MTVGGLCTLLPYGTGTCHYAFRCEQVLFVRFYSNPASVNRSMQFHYCTISNPGTGADDAFVLKRCM